MIRTLLEQNFLLMIISFTLAMSIAPGIIGFLYKYKVVRKLEDDFSAIIEERKSKKGTPIMGGLLVIISLLLLSGMILLLYKMSSDLLNNKSILILGRNLIKNPSKIYMPLLITSLTAILGGIDDYLNIYGKKRIIRTISKQIKLAKVHKYLWKRITLWITLPYTAYLNIWYAFGSYPGKGLHAGEKIALQTGIAYIAAHWLYFSLGLSSLWIPFVGNLHLGILIIPFSILTLISMQNAVNITDGMDGLSSGLAISAFLAFTLLAALIGETEISYINAIATGSILAYLYFNIKPARIELGDLGSLAIGILLGIQALTINRALILPIIGLSFVIEIASSLTQTISRKILGRRIFKMAPLHYHFQIKGWSEEKIVMRFWLFGIIFAIIGLWLGLQ